MKAFINGRTVFGTPVKAFPPVYPSKMVSVCCLNTTVAGFGGLASDLSHNDLFLFLPGVFLWSWSSHWGRSGSKWPLLPHLWQDRPLHERLSPAQKVRIITCLIWPCDDKCFFFTIYHATCFYNVLDNCIPGPGTEGTLRKGQITWETQLRTARTRADTGVSTGGKGIHRKCAAASCVDQVPTSRRTVSCTEALQVWLFFLWH